MFKERIAKYDIMWGIFNAVIVRTSTLFSFSVNFAGLTTYQEQGL